MPFWLQNLFLNPSYVLPGAALLSVPIIIHLINRLRFKRVRFAAMEFLLASQQRNRRRVLLEQLLLLALRMLLVALLVGLIARPILDPRQWAFLRGERTQHYVLLDDSGSLRDRGVETTAFDAAKDVVRRLAAEGERQPDTQTLTLVKLSSPDTPIFNRETINSDFVSRLESELKNLKCSHQALDLAEGLVAARRQLTEQPGTARNLHLISDFRKTDWDDDTVLAKELKQLDADGVSVNLVKTVPEWHGNLGLTELTGAIDVAAANVPLRLSVTVRNYGEQSYPKANEPVALEVRVDGQKRLMTESIDTIEPGQEVVRQFDVQFERTGSHDVRVSLPADALDQDNQRYLAVNIPEANSILIIDGNPTASEAFYLADALAPAPGLTGFAPTIEPIEYLRRHPLDKFQSIFLLNVAELPPDSVRALDQFVSRGGGLCWYLGDQVRAAFYNDKLYREGKGIFPCRLGIPAVLALDNVDDQADVELGDHPMFEGFRGEDRTTDFARKLHVDRYFGVPRDWSPPEGVQIIADLRNRAPLFLEHRFGLGQIVTCLTTVGFDWTNWPQEPGAYVPLQLELAKRIARRRQALEIRVVGEPIPISLDAGSYRPEVKVSSPDGPAIPLTLSLANESSGEGAASDPGKSETPAVATVRYEGDWKNTDEPGLYSVLATRQDGAEEIRRISVNAPAAESELELITGESLRRSLGAGHKIQIHEPGDLTWIRGEQSASDLHDYVILALLVFFALEQAMSFRLSYHTKPAGARA
ncbi:MAG: BatA domain-containing protein [Planctomycetota bacterium]|nr:BatA domain-containing protein [Planctomycetota bacterium]